MSHSSSGLRGVTLNDLFVVTAKRATDMRSLAEPVHHGKILHKPKESTWHYLSNVLYRSIAQASLYLGAYTLSDVLLPLSQQGFEAADHFVVQVGPEHARIALAALAWTVFHLLFGQEFHDALKRYLPIAPEKPTDPSKGYIARISLPNAAISQGTLKVTYSVTPDALVIRSLKDHAITVISMEMICCVFEGDAAVFDERDHEHRKAVSGCGRNHSGDPDCCGEFDAKTELECLKIETKEKLLSWFQGDTRPVVVSLKSGHAKVPLIIHGLYFDGQASPPGASKKFADEFNAALCAFRKSQVGHGHQSHDDYGSGHGHHG